MPFSLSKFKQRTPEGGESLLTQIHDGLCSHNSENAVSDTLNHITCNSNDRGEEQTSVTILIPTIEAGQTEKVETPINISYFGGLIDESNESTIPQSLRKESYCRELVCTYVDRVPIDYTTLGETISAAVLSGAIEDAAPAKDELDSYLTFQHVAASGEPASTYTFDILSDKRILLSNYVNAANSDIQDFVRQKGKPIEKYNAYQLQSTPIACTNYEMVNNEEDDMVGCREAGDCIYSPVDGNQPARCLPMNRPLPEIPNTRSLPNNEILTCNEEAGYNKLIELSEGKTGYKGLALFRLSSESYNKDNFIQAIEFLKRASEDSSLTKKLREFAKLKAGLILVDHGTVDDVKNLLNDITVKNGPFAFHAKEIIALSLLNNNMDLEAKLIFEDIASDVAAPPVLARRAEIFLK